MSLAGAMAALADAVRMTPGVVYTSDDPPDQLADFQFPAILIFPLRGEGELATAYGGNGLPVEERHVTLRLDLHLRAYTQELDELTIAAVAANEPLSLKIWRRFLTDQFNKNVTVMGTETTPPIRWQFVTMGWGGQPTLGFTYELDLTVMEDIP